MAYGDRLASGGRSAAFLPPKVSAKRWKEIWQDEIEDEEEEKLKDDNAEIIQTRGSRKKRS